MAAKSKSEFSSFSLIPLAGAAVGFVVSAVAAFFIAIPAIDSQHVEGLIEIQANNLAKQLDQKILDIQTQHATLANNLYLANMVEANNPAQRSREENNMKELIPGAVRVRIFGIGQAEVQRDATPPFNFTSLDMVKRSEAGESVHPEAINAGARWVLSVATPIRSPGDPTIRGTLFVYQDMAALINQADTDSGQVRVLQEAGANPVVILDSGSAGSGQTAVQRELSNPSWKMQYTASAEFASARASNIILLIIPLAIFTGIMVAAVFVNSTRNAAQLKSDLSHMDHQIASVAAQNYEPSSRYTFKSFIPVDDNLSRLGPKSRGLSEEDVEALGELKQKTKGKKAQEIDDGIVEIEMDDEDEEADDSPANDVPASIFRAYDIRGIVNDTLTPETIKLIGLAIGSAADAAGEKTILVGADGRLSGPAVMDTLIEGILETGCDVLKIGLVPTPALYFATHNSDTKSGVMVTGSHNPPDYNGFKIVIGGRTLVDEDIKALYARIVEGDFASGKGEVTEIDIKDDYIEAIADDVVVAQPLKVVLDCGNGIAGEIAPGLVEELGCEVVKLYCDVDGNFPNHPPDPTVPANLEDLKAKVAEEGADLGIAFDGDGDRMVAISKSGEIIWPDRLLMLFAKDVVTRNPGSDVVYDVKCTRHLNNVISGYGGRGVLCRTGHSFMKAKMVETGAMLGGEMSGHICFKERWFGFDDGVYAAARLLEIVGAQEEGLDELMEEFPSSLVTPEILIRVSDDAKFGIMEQIVANEGFTTGTLTTIDGIRVDFDDGWGLIRASNTNPTLTLRFEADDEASMERIKGLFREQLHAVREDLNFT